MKNCLFPGKQVRFPTISYVFLYLKYQNFPPNINISWEGAFQLSVQQNQQKKAISQKVEETMKFE